MKKIAVFDIDGTLADISKRIESHKDLLHLPHWHKDFNWEQFFDGYSHDKPITWTIDLLKVFYTHPDYRVFILTARSETVRRHTVDWLNQHSIPFDELIMRPLSDYRKDEEVKASLMEIYKPEIHFILDDRIAIGHYLRDQGYSVLLCDHVDF